MLSVFQRTDRGRLKPSEEDPPDGRTPTVELQYFSRYPVRSLTVGSSALAAEHGDLGYMTLRWPPATAALQDRRSSPLAFDRRWGSCHTAFERFD